MSLNAAARTSDGRSKHSNSVGNKKKPHVPKFGNWEEDDDVPYTQYFDTAQMGKSIGKMMNPNDPLDNPHLFPGDASPVHVPPPGRKSNAEARKVPHRKSKEFAAHHQPAGLFFGNEAVTRKLVERQQKPTSSSSTRSSSVGARSSSRSSTHQDDPARHGSRGAISSATSERRPSVEGSRRRSAPARTTRPNVPRRSIKTSNRSSMVPKLGEWQESDRSSSADGYTHTFDRVRENNRPAVVAARVVVPPPTISVPQQVDQRRRNDQRKPRDTRGKAPKQDKSSRCNYCSCFAP